MKYLHHSFLPLLLAVFLLSSGLILSAFTGLGGTACAAPDAGTQAAQNKDQNKAGGNGKQEKTKTPDKAGSDAKAKAEGKTKADAKAKEEKAKADAEAEAKRREAEQQQKKEEQAKEAEQKRKEAAEMAENDPWKDMWQGQRVMIQQTTKEAKEISSSFLSETGALTQIPPVEKDVNRLFVMANNLKDFPSPLEAISRQLSIQCDLVQSIAATAGSGSMQAVKMLERMNRITDSMPKLGATSNAEIHEYMGELNKAHFMLAAVITRYASALAPTRAFIAHIKKTQQDITDKLPTLWKRYYTLGPVAWLSSNEWASLPRRLGYVPMGLKLRRPVELPSTNSQWQTAIFRLIISMVLLSVIGTILVAKFLNCSPDVRDHVLRWSMPWNVIGLSLLSSSISSELHTYSLLLALGNLSLIMGQIFLAWDLRRMKYTEITQKSSPLWHLVPLTMCAYVLLYMPMPRLLALLGWMLCCVGNLVVRHFRRQTSLGGMQLESFILELEPVILWVSLFICLLGFHVYSMVLYLLYTSLSIATELSMGSMWFISTLNERLPKEGAQAILASLAIALAAPCMLVLALLVVSLWLGTLPGGIYIMQFYVFKGVNIGSAQLNLAQVLLIITAFFLARTATSMGSAFIEKMPKNGMHVDSSLVTPLQTAFTYLIWIAFGLFVLRSLGMNLSSLAVIAGGLSVGIGFGMQTIVNNLISGLILIFSRALQVGDVVEVGGVLGRIKKITMRATVVETYESATIYVPNSEFMSGHLTNWTSNNRTRRMTLKIGVAYGSDTDLVIKLLKDCAQKNDGILAFPEPRVVFTDFGNNTLDFSLYYWLKDFNLIVTTPSTLRLAINEAFNKAHIEIAFPQLDVHVKDLPPKSVPYHAANPDAQSRKKPALPRRVIKRRTSSLPQAAAK